MSLRLGFYYHAPSVWKDGALWLPGYIGRFVDELAGRADHLVCFLHPATSEERKRVDYRITASNVTWIDLGLRGSVIHRVLHSRKFARRVQDHLPALDALLIRGPSPLLPAFASTAGVPVSLLLVGDYVSSTVVLRFGSWRQLATNLWARWNRRQQTRLAKRTLTFVNSERLYRSLDGTASHLKLVATNALREDDGYIRKDTCNKPPYRLLYTGQLARSKGIFELVEAVHHLTCRGLDVVLDLVGWSDPGDEKTVTVLKERSKHLGVEDRVLVQGFKTFGPELFAYYRRADIYVMPSYAEGFPRAIWEALAFSVPVVATRVGGIPFALQNDFSAKLIRPQSSRAIADAVESLAADSELRKVLICNGRELARENTLDRSVEELTSHLSGWLERDHSRDKRIKVRDTRFRRPATTEGARPSASCGKPTLRPNSTINARSSSENRLKKSVSEVRKGPTVQDKKVLLVGNFLSQHRSTRTVCEELEVRLSEIGWSVVTTSQRLSRSARLLDMLLTAWRRREDYSVAQVDVYSGPSFIWAEAVCFVLAILNKPFILTLHGGNLPVFSRRWPRRVKRLLATADVVTTPAPYLIKEMSLYRPDLVWIRNAIDLRRYTFRLRDEIEPKLIWIRAFHEIYNPSLVPYSIELLSEDYPDVHIMMVGPDKGDGSLQRMRRIADKLGVSDRISIVGGVDKEDVPQWLLRGDIFVNTTNVDSVPVSVVEAMACGLCVVSTNVGGMPYLVDHGDDGLLAEPDNPQLLADAVRRVLRSPALARRLSSNANRKAKQFDWSIILPQWDELLSRVADRA